MKHVASAWRQGNADWWSEIKKTNHVTHHPEISPTNDVEQWIQMTRRLDN
jgi:hypothetical protein